MYNIILEWARLFLHLYFRRIIVYGKENVPKNVPLIVASNHPSAFMEASVLAIKVGRQIHFMVRGDVFNPKFRWLFKWTNQIPIYRQKDGISNLRKNASSFDLTYRKLADGEAVLIFPEAKSLLEKKMRPIQRGTAHLAFGTIPYLENGKELWIVPVGVNFMDPRIPGTDVVVQFGKPFVSPRGSRDDRDAIEAFTEQLAVAMQPLIVQVNELSDEPRYDVLASIYMSRIKFFRPKNMVLEDEKKIAEFVNQSETNQVFLKSVDGHNQLLKQAGLQEAVYFPRLLVVNKIFLLFEMILKALWWISGGWIWRLTRKFIYSKLRTDTFQGPTSLGAAMVLMPLIALILFIVFWIVGIPLELWLSWLILMMWGKTFPAPLSLMWKIFTASGKTLNVARKNVISFTEEVEKLYK